MVFPHDFGNQRVTGPSSDLLQRGEAGDPGAQIALGRHYEGLDDVRKARGWFARAAKAGSVEAMRLLALNLLGREPVVAADGVGILHTAAHRGDAQAAYVCGLLDTQSEALERRWPIAIASLRDAAARGMPGADRELELLTGNADEDGSSDAFDATAFAAALRLEEISAAPRLYAIRNFLRPDLCDWLSEGARQRLERASVYDPATGSNRIERARSNSHLTFNVIDSNFIVMLLRDRIAATARRPLMSLERTALLHYDPGEAFAPHFDFLDTAIPAYAREVAEHGQRVATLLIYLNEDYEGGETEFLELGLRHRASKGDALLFWNVDAAGAPDRRTFHAGRPTTRGEKWVLSQWVRGPGMR